MSIDWEKMGELKKFSPQEFVDLKKVPDESMAIAQIKQDGLVYIPHACKKKSCDLHINLHGWNGGVPEWVSHMDILPYAATNDIIVLYPFSKCWWFVGQAKEDHPDWAKTHTNQAVQLEAIVKMIKRATTNPIDKF